MTWIWPALLKHPLTPSSLSMAALFTLLSSASTSRSRVAQWAALTMFSLPPSRGTRSWAIALIFIFFLL